jgi:uncharacterized protein (TIGR03435 family)
VFAQTPAWETAAGGAMSFEVASIHLSDPAKFTPPLFALDQGDHYAATGGRFFADFELGTYIQFAYKISLSRSQWATVLAPLPKWVATDLFSIQAKAPIPNPTKDQMRLMMRALLIERFHLQMHFEPRETDVYLLVLDKPGKSGPGLVRHEDGAPCDKPDTNAVPANCDVTMLRTRSGRLTAASRHTTLELIADTFPGMGGVDRPVVDRTGLTGRYDFKLEWVEEAPSQPGASPGPGPLPEGPSFRQALREQLGLKLESAKVSLRVPVIDRVERPSEN